jgi:hypothetical protein
MGITVGEIVFPITQTVTRNCCPPGVSPANFFFSFLIELEKSLIYSHFLVRINCQEIFLTEHTWAPQGSPALAAARRDSLDRLGPREFFHKKNRPKAHALDLILPSKEILSAYFFS